MSQSRLCYVSFRHDFRFGINIRVFFCMSAREWCDSTSIYTRFQSATALKNKNIALKKNMQPSSFTVFFFYCCKRFLQFTLIFTALSHSHTFHPFILKNNREPVERFTPVSCLTTQFVLAVCFCFRRGLNPPHRVKSISMTTFSQQEVEFLQNHGNEVSGRSTST